MNEASNSDGRFRSTGEMTIEELRDEFTELQEEVDMWEPYEGQEEAWDRREEVWNALEERSDVELPECPVCGHRKWAQVPGDPVECVSCGRSAPPGMETEVHDAWRRIQGIEESEA